MDHEKPQAVIPPQIFEFDIDQSRSRTSPDVEPDYPEDRRERRGESLWYVISDYEIFATTNYLLLGERLVNGILT